MAQPFAVAIDRRHVENDGDAITDLAAIPEISRRRHRSAAEGQGTEHGIPSPIDI
jgi:hypothetical protein